VDSLMLPMLYDSGLMIGLNHQLCSKGICECGSLPHAEISFMFVSRTRPPWMISPRT
jgi:hypothetical protein